MILQYFKHTKLIGCRRWGNFGDVNDRKRKPRQRGKETIEEMDEETKKKTTRKRKKKKKHYDKGYRNELIKLLITSGGISYKGLCLLSKNRIMYQRKLIDMKNEGIVEIFSKNRTRIARLKDFENTYETYIGNMPVGYYGYYNQHGKILHKYLGTKEENGVKAERAIRIIEINLIMNGTENIRVYPEEKPRIDTANYIPEEGSYYYTISELRQDELFRQSVKEKEKGDEYSITSRAVGLLISPDGNYPVYHTGEAAMLWRKSAEGQLSYSLAMLLKKKRTNMKTPVFNGIQECIIFADNMEVFGRIILGKKGRNLNMDSGYKAMYALPYDSNGQKILEKMTFPNWKTKLNTSVLKGYDTEIDKASSITYDGRKKQHIALNFCCSDIQRLNKFIKTMQWICDTNTENIYEIFCYTFQEPLIKSLTSELNCVNIVSVEL